MQKNFFFHELAIVWSAKKWSKDTFFSFLHYLSLANFANATAVAFSLLCNSWFYFHWYTQCEPTPTQKSAWKWQLQPFVTSCAKDYEGHSLLQTSLAELPNIPPPCPLTGYKKKQKEGSHLLVLYQQAKVALKDRTAAAKVNSQSLQSMYWVVQWSWFAQVNALCNLSCKKLWQVSASPPGQFLSRHCFMLCITMKVECKIVKQYKCYHCCSCKNHREKEWRVGKKVPLPRFLADQNTANLWEK